MQLKCRICNQEIENNSVGINSSENNAILRGICLQCYRKYNIINRDDFTGKIYVKHCIDHGPFIVLSTSANCFKCIESIKDFEKENLKLTFEELNKKFIIIEGFSNIKTKSSYVIVTTKFGDYFYKNCLNCNLWTLSKDHIARKIQGIIENKKNFCNTTCMDEYQHRNNNFHYFCIKCGQELQNPSQICPRCNYNPDKDKNYRCHICGSKLNNALQTCPNCNNRINVEFKCLKCGNKLDNPVNICEKCGYKNENIKGFVPNFITKGNILYFYNKQLNDYVPWTVYKSQFKTFNIDWQLPDGFRIIPTFRSQDSDSWSGAKAAFEQSLVDLGISWFVYIKFYISSDNQILPLVIGKSGSLLVNASGSDLSFSTDTDDGPARCFLAEEGLDWCKTQIATFKCDNEIAAYEQECRFAAQYNLFES